MRKKHLIDVNDLELVTVFAQTHYGEQRFQKFKRLKKLVDRHGNEDMKEFLKTRTEVAGIDWIVSLRMLCEALDLPESETERLETSLSDREFVLVDRDTGKTFDVDEVIPDEMKEEIIYC